MTVELETSVPGLALGVEHVGVDLDVEHDWVDLAADDGKLRLGAGKADLDFAAIASLAWLPFDAAIQEDSW